MNTSKGLLFLITIFTTLIFINSTPSAEIIEPIRDGDYIYIDDNKAYLKGTYLATHGENIEHWVMTKTYSGDCDMAIGFNSEVAWPTKVLLEDSHYKYWDTNTSNTFYYVTNFATTTYTQDYGNWYNPKKYKFNHKIHIGYDNTTNEPIWKDVIGTVAYFDSQTNDGTNYTVTWHTEHSQIEQYRDISDRILSNPIEYEYDGKNLWFITKDIPMTASVMRNIIIEMDGKIEHGEHSYKYDIIWKPSHQTISEARVAGNLYILDPYWNVSFDVYREIHINNTVGDSVTDFQLVSVNLSSFNINASSSRIVNSTSGLQEDFWNESVDASGNLEYVYCNFSSIPTGAWINTTYRIYYQTTPVASSASDGIATFEFFDDFNDGNANGWTTDPSTAISSAQAKDGGYSVYITDTSSGAGNEGRLERSDFNYQTGVLEFDWKRTTSSQACNLVITDGGSIAYYVRMYGSVGYAIQYYDGAFHDYSGGPVAQTADTWEKHTIAFDEPNSVIKAWIDDVYLGTGARFNNVVSIDNIKLSSRSSAATGTMGYIDRIRLRKYTTNEPEPWTVGEIKYYANSLHYNISSPYNLTITDVLTANHSISSADDINDTAQSTGTTYLQVTNFNNTENIVRNFTIYGDDLDWYQVENITGSYNLKNSSGIIQTVNDGNFTTNIVEGDYWIEEADISIVLLSQTPTTIYTNSTGYINISYGITHSMSGLNNTSVSFIYRNYDYDLSDSNHSIRPPSNNLASEWNFDGRILRGANRNETPGLNFENNDTITGGDIYTWSGLDENSTKLTIIPVNSTYTLVYINATVHCIMPQMWYLDRTDQQQATKTQLPIHKTQNVLIKFWNFEIFKGNYDFLGVGYTDTSLSSNPALWPSDANHVNFYYINSSYDPATGGDPITSGYAVYMGSLNASGWVDYDYSRSNSNYVRGFIDNNYLHTVINTTNISYLYFTSNTESSKPYYINMTNVASSTNVSFANTNTLWVGNTPPYTPQAYTPNMWFAFMKLNMSLDHKLYVADNNDLWGSSSMNRTNITQALFPPTTPTIDHFHFLGETDYDMDGVYYENFSIGCGVSSDPDGGDVTHNLTLHYDNGTFVTIINNTFTDKDITHNGVYFDANFSSIPYYSDDVNYTLRLIATDDESETVTVWLGVNFTLSITPIITLYTPSTPATTIQHDTQEFTINISQIVNVTWYIDGSVVSTENNTNYSTYSNSTAPIGTYNVTSHVENVNGTRQQVWEWIVEDPVFAALLQLQADIDKMKRTQTIIQALIFLVIGVIVGVVAQRRRFNDEDSEKQIESKNN